MQLREIEEFERALNREPSPNREMQEIKCPDCDQTLDLSGLDDHPCRCKHCRGDFPSFLLSQHYLLCPSNADNKRQRGKKLTLEQINQLPEFSFDPKRGTEIKCMVCMEEFQFGERLRLLTCLHGFHTACIGQWLSLKGICPICKLPVDL